MAKILIKDYASGDYPNHMWYVDNAQWLRYRNTHGLTPYKLCLVDVCGFRFVFHSVMQIELCHAYYGRNVHPSQRLPVYRENLGGDHYETQRWFEKLPARLSHHSKRPKVLAALKRAMAQFKQYPGAMTGTPKPPLVKWSGNV